MISPTRIRDLVGYAAAVTLITWLALRHWYGDLPRLSWFVPLSLLLLAIAETLAANQLRDRIRRRPGALPVEPLVAARMLALAKASRSSARSCSASGPACCSTPCRGWTCSPRPAATPHGHRRCGRAVCADRGRVVAGVLLPRADTAGQRPAD